MIADLSRPLQLKDALPVPDFTRPPITRDRMRRTLVAMGFEVRAAATRDEMELLMQREGIHPSVFEQPLRAEPVYRHAPPPAEERPKISIKGRSANELRALCKSVDPTFKPPMKSNRFVYISFLAGKGLVDINEAFEDAD